MNTDPAVRDQIRRARGNFVAMAATYSLGVFNDNFFRQAILLLAAGAGLQRIQGYATIIFAAPFIVFAAYAGWLADEHSKRNVTIGSKALELAAMICGALGIWLGSVPLMLVMLGIMATQATIFNPALNGSIPELYPESYVITANAILKVAVTASILMGIAVSGVVLDLDKKFAPVWGVPAGRFAIGAGVILISLLGLITSLGVPHRPAAAPGKPFPWAGPWRTIKDLYELRKDFLLGLVIFLNLYIWFVGTLLTLVVNALGVNEHKWSNTRTSLMLVAELSGIAVGGLIASRIAKGTRWYKVLAPAGVAMSLFLLMVPFASRLSPAGALPWYLVMFAGVGIAGGIIVIPCEAFIQIRPRHEEKGTIIAASNCAAFIGILLAGPMANLLLDALEMAPSRTFFVTGGLSLAVSLLTWALLAWKEPA